jgi:selenium-binding protein 1
MALWTPDPTFCPSPKMAMEAPPEKLAFVAMLNIGNHCCPGHECSIPANTLIR